MNFAFMWMISAFPSNKRLQKGLYDTQTHDCKATEIMHDHQDVTMMKQVMYCMWDSRILYKLTQYGWELNEDHNMSLQFAIKHALSLEIPQWCQSGIGNIFLAVRAQCMIGKKGLGTNSLGLTANSICCLRIDLFVPTLVNECPFLPHAIFVKVGSGICWNGVGWASFCIWFAADFTLLSFSSILGSLFIYLPGHQNWYVNINVAIKAILKEMWPCSATSSRSLDFIMKWGSALQRVILFGSWTIWVWLVAWY